MPVLALVRFQPKTKRSQLEDRSYLDEVMPMFEGVDGLSRKYFGATETGGIGVYEWSSEQAATDYYTDEWLKQIGTMATDVTVEFLPVRGMVDNQAGETKNYLARDQ